jgi:acetyl-CoA C-acetyltransferase
LQLGALIADWIGAHQKESLSLESACGSGAAAFRAGLMAVSSGELSSALIVGVEKMTDSPINEITASLVTASDAELEGDFGVSFVALNALLMRRYMHEYGWESRDFSGFSINAHANAIHNPNARFHNKISAADFERAGMISDPINLMDASPVCDGAAAIFITNGRANGKHRSVSVAASAAATDTISLQHRSNPLQLFAAQESARKAYAQAGIGPKDVGVFEYHDAFSIMAALALESCGFCELGQGPRMALEEKIKIDGEIPVATMGGLKARGHPVGATGIYQLVEVTLQLRGEAGATQVKRNRYGMAQNIGGSGSNILTHILRQE